MREFTTEVGGRYTYKEDWENMQDLALSVSKIFSGCSPFVMSGCTVSGTAGNMTIAAGYIWMNDKIRYFEGKTGIDLSISNYLIENHQIYSVKYSGGGVKTGVDVYNVNWTTSIPAHGEEYILIPSSGVLPNANDTFFGKYAILSDTTFSKQTINKALQIDGALDVGDDLTLGSGTDQVDLNVNRMSSSGKLSQVKQTISSTGVGALQGYYDGNKIGEFIFDPINKVVTIKINGAEQIVITESGVQVKPLVVNGSISNNVLRISENSINKISEDTDTSSLNINNVGFNGGTTRFRDFGVYNGKMSQIAKFIGSSKSFVNYGSITQSGTQSVSFQLQDSSKVSTDTSIIKSIKWLDKNSTSMLSFGYLSSLNKNATIDNSLIGDVEVIPKQYFKSTKPIMEEGVILSDKYANKTSTATAISGKVDKDGTKVLSTNDFTNSLKNKLDSIGSEAEVAPDDANYVTGGQVYDQLEKKLDIVNNLSDVDAVSARGNLSVQSIATADGKYVKKSNNLSDVNAAASRANLNVPAIGDSYLKSEVYVKGDVLTKTEVSDSYQPILIDTGYVTADNTDLTPQFNIKIRRYGNVVNIIGFAQKMGAGKIWFTVPSNIPSPPFSTGQVTSAQAANTDRNRGMSIKCDGGNKNFYVREEDNADTLQYVNITYLV